MSNVKIILLGDATEGLKYAPTAMWYAKKMRIDGLAHGMSRVLPLADGVMLRVNLDDFTGDKAYIDAGGSCPLINTNSFLDTFKARIRPPGHTPRYLINKQLTEELREVIMPPATEPSPKLSFIRTVADPDTKTLTVRLPIEATLTETTDDYGEVLDPPQKTVDYSLFKETYDRLLPTKFTGLMRRVVQATMATDTWSSFAPTTNPVAPALAPINYQYGNSWGCIKCVGADGKNKYYFIEIGVQSVYYVPADYCVHKVKVKGVDTDAVILRSADTSKKVKIGEIPAGIGSSWDTEMGWAFSYDSPEASIVLNNGVSALTTDGYMQDYVTTSLLTLTFGFDAAGIPNAAALAKTEPQIFYNNMYFMFKPTGRNLFNVVGHDENGKLCNVTVDFGPRLLAHASPVGYVADRIPVYVYYTEAGRQVCEYSYKTVASKTDTATSAPTRQVRGASNWNSGSETLGFVSADMTDILHQSFVGAKSEAGYVDYGFSVSGAGRTYASAGRNDNYGRYQIGELYGQKEAPFAKFEYWSYHLKSGPAPDPPNPPGTYYELDVYPWTVVSGSYSGWSGAGAGYSIGDSHRLTYETNTDSGGGRSVDGSITLSVLDRECALLYTISTTASRSYSSTVQVGQAVHYYVDCPMFFSMGGDGPSCITNTVSAVKGPLFNRIWYSTCGNVEITNVTSMSFPRTKMHLYPSEEPISDFWYTGGVFGGLGYVTKQDPTTVTTPNPSGCGDVSYPGWAAQTSDAQYGFSTTNTTPASTETKLTLYSHNDPIQMVQGNNTSHLFQGCHPLDGYPLAYVFMQAAFDPSNYVMHSGDLNSALVVKFQGKTYDVEHTKNASPGLFGFLGAV